MRYSLLLLLLPTLVFSEGTQPIHKVSKNFQAGVIAQDRAAVLRYRKSLIAITEYQDSKPELFPSSGVEETMVSREAKEEVWGVWQRFLDTILALDAVRERNKTFYRLRGENRANALRVRYGAFLTQYHWAMEFIERAERAPHWDKVLNDAVPELGLPKGTYARLKFRFLNAGKASEFAATEVLYKAVKPKIPTPLSSGIEADASYLWKAGTGKGPKLTAKNALKVTRNLGHDAWLPVQTGIANWLGDTRVRRKGKSLIGPDKIKELQSQLLPGDVMVQRREWFMTNIGIPGWWTHAALYIGTAEERATLTKDPAVREWVRTKGQKDGDFEELLRKNFPGPYADSLIEPEEGHPARVLEAIASGVTFTSIEHSAHADSLGALRPKLTNSEIAVAIYRAFGYQGRPYDYDFDFATDAAIVCSELVYKAYQPSSAGDGLKLPLGKVMGRAISPPNDFVKQFDAQTHAGIPQFSLVAFLDGHERTKDATFSDLASFRSSWKRPKWHIIVQDLK